MEDGYDSPEIIQAFIQDTGELLDQVESDLLKLSGHNTPEAEDSIVEEVFRNFHTIKGNSSFLSFSNIEKLSHTTESLLHAVIERNISFSQTILDLLLETIDVLRTEVASISQGECLANETFDHIINEVVNITQTISQSTVENPEEPTPIIEKGHPKTSSLSKQPSLNIKESIRVNIDKLDLLVALVGELVISESMISHHPELNKLHRTDFHETLKQLGRNIRELQSISMTIRMVPISILFTKLSRLVQDLSTKVEKQIEIVFKGGETELDKTVAEKISDPVLHLIRNSVDHGIETDDEREQKKKPKVAKIRFEAKNVGSEIWITIADDGKGLNREKILEKAEKKKLVEKNEKLSDSEIWNLIFASGFSTKEFATDLSGRGRGMSVVKENIDLLGGRIDISSKSDIGSSFTMKMPLTLAIINAMIVVAGSIRYVIPFDSIITTFRPHEKDIVYDQNGREAVHALKRFVPIIQLHEVNNETSDRSSDRGEYVIVEESNRRVCLYLDEIVGRQQIVIKALPESIKGSAFYSGCTILGDGRVSMILNIAGIIDNYNRNKKKQSTKAF